MGRSPEKVKFAESIADYIKDHSGWNTMTPYDAAIEAVMVILDDIGAAQGCLNALEVPIDLYSSWDKFENFSFPSEISSREVNMKRTVKRILKYAAFFLAGSAAAGWAISEEAHKDQ